MTRLYTIFIAAAAAIAALPAMAAEAEPQAAAAAVSPLAAQPLEKLSATRDRPLFSPTRRPPAPPPIVAAAPPPPPPPPEVALLGVVMDGEEARAIIRTGPAAKVTRVRIGDDVGGWKVGQIEAQRLVLLLDDRTATFTLFTSANNRPANPATLAQSPVDQDAHSAAQASPSPNNSATVNPETAPVRRPHPQQQ
jgi:hypothetical protein